VLTLVIALPFDCCGFLHSHLVQLPADACAGAAAGPISCTARRIELNEGGPNGIAIAVRERNMKRLVLVAATLAILCAPLTLRAEQPPIIDRDLFFGDVGGAQISPDGQFVSFLKSYAGARNIWVKKTGEPFSAARRVSVWARVRDYFWSRDSKFILYTQDLGGDENFNLYQIDLTLFPDVPPARELTNQRGVQTLIYSMPTERPDIIYLGLNDRDPRWHDLYELHLSTGEKLLLHRNTERITNWVFDHDATPRLAVRRTETGDKEFLRVDPDGFKVVYTCDVLESCDQQGFDTENKLVYMLTNKGPLNLLELEMLDPATGATTPVESDPQGRVDFGGLILSEADHRVLFTQYEDDGIRRYFKDHAFEVQLRWLESQFPGKEVRLGARTRELRLDAQTTDASPGARTTDESLWIVSVCSDTEPGEIYLWNPAAHTLTLQYRVSEDLPREALSERRPYHYTSSDGLDIPAYLTLPKGLPAANLPLIVNPHGGPWAQYMFGYNGFAQFLANRGYAVLQPNFRGSTGYGKAYLNAGNGEWGRKMQDDLTWGVKALVADGTVDPKRVGIVGGSYGGYATLAGVAFTPDLYAAAVDMDGPSNLVTFINAIPPYWESGSRFWYAHVADPRTEQGKALLTAESPLARANAIVAPLMVVHGKNDPRVNIQESSRIVAALRDAGKPVEYLAGPYAGHGYAQYAAMESFLAQYLGGRSQEDVPADIAAKPRDIRVDSRAASGAAPSKEPGANPSK
jgi:dipeptidyl aminopeptidase/acylaminoacyl peptidase